MDLVSAFKNISEILRLPQITKTDAARTKFNALMRFIHMVTDALIALVTVDRELLEPNVAALTLVTVVEGLAVRIKVCDELANRAVLVPQGLSAVRADLGQRLDSPAEAAPHSVRQLLGERVVKHFFVVAPPAAKKLSARFALELCPCDIVRTAH